MTQRRNDWVFVHKTMFVLQECSVCFEEFDAERTPHNIPCGHVFCSPCLESLVSSSPSCPNCRVSYSSASIRKVVCSQQDSAPNPQPDKSNESEAESFMWQAIRGAIESPFEFAQRRSLVEHNSEEAMIAAGMSGNALTAFCAMRMLVKVEEQRQYLDEKLNTAVAVEQSLRDRISMLESKLSEYASQNTSSRDIKLLMADFQKMQTAIESIDKRTSLISNQLKPVLAPILPVSTKVEQPLSPANVPIPPTPAESSRPALLRKPSPQNTSKVPTDKRASTGSQFQPFAGIASSTGKQPLSPPQTPGFNQGELTQLGHTATARVGETSSRNNAGRVSTTATSMGSPPPRYQTFVQAGTPVTAPMQPPKTQLAAAPPVPHPDAQQGPPSPVATRNQSSTNSSPPSVPNKPTASRTLTALHDFTAESEVEHSLKRGDTLYLFPESDLESDWIWCKDASDKRGYVPKCYVKVDVV